MLWIHYLFGISHIAVCHENQPVNVREMLINLNSSDSSDMEEDRRRYRNRRRDRPRRRGDPSPAGDGSGDDSSTDGDETETRTVSKQFRIILSSKSLMARDPGSPDGLISRTVLRIINGRNVTNWPSLREL